MGGAAYMYDRTMDTFGPVTASASVIDIPGHSIVSKVYNSLIKVKEKIKVLEEKIGFDN